MNGISQSTLLTGVLLAAFVLFLAAKNRLVTYANVLWGSQESGASQPPTGAPNAATGASSAPAAAPTPAPSTSPFVGSTNPTPSGAPAASSPAVSTTSPNATALLKNAFTQMGNGAAQQDIPWTDTAESIGLTFLGL